MHPSLSKSERKVYAGFDPDKWYQWNEDVSSKFAELMRRSPRDTSFARGFAYVAQKAVPEGHYIQTTDLVRHLDALPAAFRDGRGSGFQVTSSDEGRATIHYEGMPGFDNVCIAIQGELVQRLEASGATGIVVRHGETCRLSGGSSCTFEIEWAGEVAPKGAQPVGVEQVIGDKRDKQQRVEGRIGNGHAPYPGMAQPAVQSAPPMPEGAAMVEPARQSVAQAPAEGGGASEPPPTFPQRTRPVQSAPQEPPPRREHALEDDLLQQLKERLAEADRQFRLYTEAQHEVERLRLELAQLRAQTDARIAEAQRDRHEAEAALEDLKQRIRSLVAET